MLTPRLDVAEAKEENKNALFSHQVGLLKSVTFSTTSMHDLLKNAPRLEDKNLYHF